MPFHVRNYVLNTFLGVRSGIRTLQYSNKEKADFSFVRLLVGMSSILGLFLMNMIVNITLSNNFSLKKKVQ